MKYDQSDWCTAIRLISFRPRTLRCTTFCSLAFLYFLEHDSTPHVFGKICRLRLRGFLGQRLYNRLIYRLRCLCCRWAYWLCLVVRHWFLGRNNALYNQTVFCNIPYSSTAGVASSGIPSGPSSGDVSLGVCSCNTSDMELHSFSSDSRLWRQHYRRLDGWWAYQSRGDCSTACKSPR